MTYWGSQDLMTTETGDLGKFTGGTPHQALGSAPSLQFCVVGTLSQERGGFHYCFAEEPKVY